MEISPSGEQSFVVSSTSTSQVSFEKKLMQPRLLNKEALIVLVRNYIIPFLVMFVIPSALLYSLLLPGVVDTIYETISRLASLRAIDYWWVIGGS